MIKRTTFFFCLLSLFTTVQAAYIEDQGPYVGILGGFGFPLNLNSDKVYGTLPGVPPVDVTGPINNKSIGGHAGVQLGYRYSALRAEGQFLWIHTPTTKVDLKPAAPHTLTADGFSNTYALMGNVFYDFFYFADETREIVTVPYFGAGIGYAQLQQTINVEGKMGGDTTIIDKFTPSGGNLAYQFIIGSNFFLDSYTSLTLDYRYFRITNLSAFDAAYTYHSVNFGINFLLDFGKW